MINWLKSFLSNRLFYVYYNGAKSNLYKITCGVPQGSCLSPTLFIAYFSDIINEYSNEIQTAHIADDLCIWASAKTKTKLEKQLQPAINKTINYCSKWGFKINKNKTCYITFSNGHKRKYQSKYSLNLKIESENIPLDPNPTLLGITLDPKLSFKDHLNQIKTKINTKINLIKRIKSFKWNTSIKTSISLYKSFIRSIFDYCLAIVQTSTEKIKNEIQKMKLATIKKNFQKLCSCFTKYIF